MFVLIKNKITGEYNTIYKKDVQEFKNLYEFFKKDPKLQEGQKVDFNFEIIEDLGEIKKILEDKFTSKGRGKEYNENLPSVTKIAYGLYPISINNDKFLIRWKNNTPLLEQEGDKDIILQRGTFIHYCLEQFVCDKEARNQDKPIITQLKILKNAKKPSKKITKQIDDKIVSDLYSGTGTIAQLMAPVAKKVIGVEIIEEAVEAARKAATEAPAEAPAAE